MSTNDFSEKCQNCQDNNKVCGGCLNQISTLLDIKALLEEMGDKWLLHKFQIAAKEVDEYKKHIVRAIHQDRAKSDLMNQLSNEEVMIIFDFAMKFLPRRFREAQTDFFAKKGKVYIEVWDNLCNTLGIPLTFINCKNLNFA